MIIKYFSYFTLCIHSLLILLIMIFFYSYKPYNQAALWTYSLIQEMACILLTNSTNPLPEFNGDLLSIWNLWTHLHECWIKMKKNIFEILLVIPVCKR